AVADRNGSLAGKVPSNAAPNSASTGQYLSCHRPLAFVRPASRGQVPIAPPPRLQASSSFRMLRVGIRPAGFEEEPSATFGLVDPGLEKAGASDISVRVA